MKSQRQHVQGWGRYAGTTSATFVPANVEDLAVSELPSSNLIARGLGRSYGDAAQRSGGSVLITSECTNVQWIDRQAGLVRADAGVTIGQLISQFTPKGWFVPVTPGTRQVTVGGAIAADIHGKNHHVDGSFGQHVQSLRMRLASDEVITLSPADNAELFWATVGGMGLTGLIIDADIQLMAIPTSVVAVETQRLRLLDDLLDEMRRSDDLHDFSVAWVDLLGNGRSVLTQGSFATPAQLEGLGRHTAAGLHQRPSTPNVGLPPFPLPRIAVTPGVKAFNELWWRKAPAELTLTGESITAFFHPLDAVTDWNRVYGRTGFVQWQCVIPDSTIHALYDIVDRLATLPSYFTVLKRFGAGNDSPLSFPAPGWTLAVDLPATPKALLGLANLDRIVAEAGGRIYLAKDARMQRELFEQMYPRLADFKAVRAEIDPGRRFCSDLSERLGI